MGTAADVFEGFAEEVVETGETTAFVRYAGEGPPVVLLHGHPRTSATWHRVAPMLLERGLSVVCPDLRGYGRSGKPPSTADHAPYSKRAMAGDVDAVMRHLDWDRYSVVGHDRGALVAFRLAMDMPDRVDRLVLMDCLPVIGHLERCDAQFACDWWHWFFFAQPEKPDRAINADPDAWYGGDPGAMGEENFRERARAIHDPATVAAMLEDYRAGLGIDREHEEADRAAGRRLRCPLFLLWSVHEEFNADPLEVWPAWAADVCGRSHQAGHHVAEEAPELVAEAVVDFLLPR